MIEAAVSIAACDLHASASKMFTAAACHQTKEKLEAAAAAAVSKELLTPRSQHHFIIVESAIGCRAQRPYLAS